MRWPLIAVLALAAGSVPGEAPAAPPAGDGAYAREVLAELVAVDTSPAHGTTAAAEAMAQRFRRAGIEDVTVVGDAADRKNVVARFHGSGKKRPILLVAHLDVVDASGDDWATDPFTLTEKDGFLYGRGSLDDKGMAAIWVATLARMKREGVVPARDVIVALTADEEEGDDNGVEWLIEHRRELVDAELALNEGGGGEIIGGKRAINEVQIDEKIEQAYVLEASSHGGLSAEPGAENAIVALATAVARVSAMRHPLRTTWLTRAYFARAADAEQGALSADLRTLATRAESDPGAAARVTKARPWYGSLLRTTCTATQIEGGFAPGALPTHAHATLDCRILPGEKPADLEAEITRLVGDAGVTVTPQHRSDPAQGSPPRADVMRAVEQITRAMWPGATVAPTMLHGATDGRHLRRAGIPTYGVSGIFVDLD